MLRSAAKNYQDVYSVCDPTDYSAVLADIRSGGKDVEFRKNLMYKVFRHTAAYDAVISEYLRAQLGLEFPDSLTYAYEKAQDLRYGENPHQKAVFYREVLPVRGSITSAKQLHGKELSFNNINDTNAALDIVKEFSEPAVVAVKHTNPCGVATAKTVSEAFKKAHDADPVSIFGGIIALNRAVDKETAEQISKIFVEVVIAPSYSPDAFALLSQKPNIRLLELDGLSDQIASLDMKKVSGGLLIQERNNILFDTKNIEIPTKKKPTKAELEQLSFAYKIVKHCKSNAIAIAKDFMSAGTGVGQTNRIWATKQAIENSVIGTKGAVLASDAFFPFGDCCEAAAAAGITAIIQPGGAKNDTMSIEVCDKFGLSMVLCGVRHFKH
jgi:phosphoribosylaminoimidazolecarboxamide formyltransferase/IMP cyclohydrolase